MALSIPSPPIPLGIGGAFNRLSVPTMGHLLAKGCLGVWAFDNLIENKVLHIKYFVKMQACFIKKSKGLTLRKERSCKLFF